MKNDPRFTLNNVILFLMCNIFDKNHVPSVSCCTVLYSSEILVQQGK